MEESYTQIDALHDSRRNKRRCHLYNVHIGGQPAAADQPVEDVSESEDKGSESSRLPSAAPEECSVRAATSRATSPARASSPSVVFESCEDAMDIFPEEGRASLLEVERDSATDPTAFEDEVSIDPLVPKLIAHSVTGILGRAFRAYE